MLFEEYVRHERCFYGRVKTNAPADRDGHSMKTFVSDLDGLIAALNSRKLKLPYKMLGAMARKRCTRVSLMSNSG